MFLSLLSIPIGAILGMVAGMLWYSPLLFGKQWMKLMGWDETHVAKKQNQSKMSVTYGLSFVALLIEAFVVRLFLRYIDVATVPQAVVMAGWIWLGFMTPVLLMTVLYGGKNPKLFWLDAGYQLVVVVAMAVVITLLS